MSLRRKIVFLKMDIEYYICRQIGKVLYHLGHTPGHSTNIAGVHSAGYGVLDRNGFWQYPVPSAYWIEYPPSYWRRGEAEWRQIIASKG